MLVNTKSKTVKSKCCIFQMCGIIMFGVMYSVNLESRAQMFKFTNQDDSGKNTIDQRLHVWKYQTKNYIRLLVLLVDNFHTH